MAEPVLISPPLTDEMVSGLRAGTRVLISGRVFTARDAAHKKMVALLEQGKELPIDLSNQIIYYVGPSPARPGRIIGACGPTTSGRMDSYTPQLLGRGLKGMIGKGFRSPDVIQALQEYRAVYFAAVGGAGALLSGCVRAAEVVAYPELGPEAIHELTVVNFPAIVVNDIYGGDLYREGCRQYAVNK
ncbi:MAG: Fe-S-containing hydro-lyase [Candidatus Desulforudis sp.]|nr:Fe-S-containing hydro-lyase [Desulforudis sp.]